METKQKIVANLGKNGISTPVVYVLCGFLALIEMLTYMFTDSWAEHLSILGTIPEALLWYWICKRLFSERKMKTDMYVLIMISYGLMLLGNVISFFEEAEAAASVFALAMLIVTVIYLIMMWIRYDGAMKQYAIWSIICPVVYFAVFLILALKFDDFDRAEHFMTSFRGKWLSPVILLMLPYLFLIDVLRENDEDEEPDENDSAEVSTDETEVGPKAEAAPMAKPAGNESPKRRRTAARIIVFVISAIVIIASAWYSISLLNDDSDAQDGYDSAFTELEENEPSTPRDNYYCGTIVVSANKDGYTNIRERPNSKSAIVGILPDGVKSERDINGLDYEVWENYAILCGNEGNWLQVETSDARGYVHKSQVKVIEDGIAVKK